MNCVWAESNPGAAVEQGYRQRFPICVRCNLHVFLIGPTLFLHAEQDLSAGSLWTNHWQNCRRMPCAHNGATCLYAGFHTQWIRRSGPFLWPAPSPHINPLDFLFVWEYLKRLVCGTSVERDDPLFRMQTARENTRSTPGIL